MTPAEGRDYRQTRITGKPRNCTIAPSPETTGVTSL
jgi:hypothetical protein